MGKRISSSANRSPGYFVYLLECGDGSLYTGITTNLSRRLREHKAGKGGHYTRAKKALEIVYFEKYSNRSFASKREAEIKKWSRARKSTLVSLARKKSKGRVITNI